MMNDRENSKLLVAILFLAFTLFALVVLSGYLQRYSRRECAAKGGRFVDGGVRSFCIEPEVLK